MARLHKIHRLKFFRARENLTQLKKRNIILYLYYYTIILYNTWFSSSREIIFTFEIFLLQ